MRSLKKKIIVGRTYHCVTVTTYVVLVQRFLAETFETSSMHMPLVHPDNIYKSERERERGKRERLREREREIERERLLKIERERERERERWKS